MFQRYGNNWSAVKVGLKKFVFEYYLLNQKLKIMNKLLSIKSCEEQIWVRRYLILILGTQHI